MTTTVASEARKQRYLARFPEREVYRHFRQRARRKGVPFLTLAEFAAWFAASPKVCEYCGINDETAREMFGHRLHVDRIEAEKGYVLGNLGYACQRCNFTKNKYLSADQMKIVAGMFFGGPRGNSHAALVAALETAGDRLSAAADGFDKAGNEWMANIYVKHSNEARALAAAAKENA